MTTNLRHSRPCFLCAPKSSEVDHCHDFSNTARLRFYIVLDLRRPQSFTMKRQRAHRPTSQEQASNPHAHGSNIDILDIIVYNPRSLTTQDLPPTLCNLVRRALRSSIRDGIPARLSSLCLCQSRKRALVSLASKAQICFSREHWSGVLGFLVHLTV